MNRKEIVKSVVIVLLLIGIVSGISYAAYRWASDPNNGLIEGISECMILDYTKGDDILNGELIFGSTYTEGLNTSVKVKISDTCTINGIGSLYINVKDDTDSNLLSSNILRYQVLDDGVEINNGIINSKGKIPIYDNIEINNTEKILTIYIWVNINDVTNDNISSLTNGYLNSSIGLDVEGR